MQLAHHLCEPLPVLKGFALVTEMMQAHPPAAGSGAIFLEEPPI